MSKQKSQAAMEFLMTYGWALLVVIIVIAALAFFGLLNPTRFLPEKADLGTGITILEATMDETFVTVLVQNNLGMTITNFQINITQCGDTGKLSNTATLPPGDTTKVQVLCRSTSNNPTPNARYTSEIIANYTTNTAGNILRHSKAGSLSLDTTVDNDLWGYWPLNGNYQDYSGNENHLSCGPCPSSTTGILGGAYYFDRTNRALETTNAKPGGTVDFSLAMWVNFEDTEVELVADSDDAFIVYIGSGSELAIAPFGGTVAAHGISWSSGWYHVAFVRESEVLSIYRNGVLLNSSANSDDLENSEIIFGGAEIGYDFFEGDLDELYYFTRAISSQEVEALYRAGQQ